tara:strand:+ start:35546 stop:35956 length:411 start_codon:yes stop_codon:yes gene_type:complete
MSSWGISEPEMILELNRRRDFYNTYDKGHWTCDVIFNIPEASRAGGPGGWALHGWTAEGQGRLVTGGPMVQGPHASLFGRASCLAARYENSTAGEHERAKAEGRYITLREGDRIECPDGTFELSLCRRGYPKLTKI